MTPINVLNISKKQAEYMNPFLYGLNCKISV